VPKSTAEFTTAEHVKIYRIYVLSLAFGALLIFEYFPDFFNQSFNFFDQKEFLQKELIFTEQQQANLKLFSDIVFWFSWIYLSVLLIGGIRLYKKGYFKLNWVGVLCMYSVALLIVYYMQIYYMLNDRDYFFAHVDNKYYSLTISERNGEWGKTLQQIRKATGCILGSVWLAFWLTFLVWRFPLKEENQTLPETVSTDL
jgi:hypothetical protein